MDNHNKTENYNSYYVIPALIAGILTGCIFGGAVWMILSGAVLGLLFAAAWINATTNKEQG